MTVNVPNVESYTIDAPGGFQSFPLLFPRHEATPYCLTKHISYHNIFLEVDTHLIINMSSAQTATITKPIKIIKMETPAKVQPSDPGVRPERASLYKRAKNGLLNLQLSSHNPVNLCAMDVVVDTLKKSLPKEVRSEVYCAPANGPDLWSDDPERCGAAMSRLESIAKEEFKPGDEFRLFKNISLKRHVIWPLWVEDQHGSHWVLLYWHS